MENIKIDEQGFVIGYARTHFPNSAVEFQICSKEDWDTMNEKERNDAILFALFESGLFEYGPVEKE